jgi:hypothetical protein
MKKINLLLLLILSNVIAFGQAQDPYEMFGHKSSVVYETPITELLYIRNKDTNSNIKALAFDVRHNVVKLLGNNDTTLEEIKIEASQVLRWLSTDPKASQAPNWSPYRAFFDNPIRYNDPDGQWEKDANGNLKAEKKDNAHSLAKYLNTDSKTAVSMLGEQGYTVNKKGVLNLKVGDIFKVESSSPTPESREDLGFMGNKVRNRAGSEFSKNMFENYWNGNGDVELSGQRFAGVLMYIKENNPSSDPSTPVILKNNDGTTSTGSKSVVSFYSSPEYNKVFGSSTIYYNQQGNVVGFYDFYDFDSKSWGQRTVKNEVITRMVETVSPGTAVPFSIRYGQSKR